MCNKTNVSVYSGCITFSNPDAQFLLLYAKYVKKVPIL